MTDAITRKAQQMDDEAAEKKARDQFPATVDILESCIKNQGEGMDTVEGRIDKHFGESKEDFAIYWRAILKKAAWNIYRRHELDAAKDALDKAGDK